MRQFAFGIPADERESKLHNTNRPVGNKEVSRRKQWRRRAADRVGVRQWKWRNHLSLSLSLIRAATHFAARIHLHIALLKRAIAN